MPHHRHPAPPLRRVRGFSLVESLVAVLLLSVSVLGAAGMQMRSLQAGQETRHQADAALLAREFGEMLHGNPAAALPAGSNPYFVQASAPLAPPRAGYCLAIGRSCTDGLSLAEAELTDWLARADALLPGARVAVCADAAPFDADGEPRWACAATADAPVVVKLGWTRPAPHAGDPPDRATVPALVMAVAPGNGT